MKTPIALLMLSLSPIFSTATEATPSAGAQPTLTYQSASSLPLPQTKGRSGSKRVGGYNSHGKGGRYIGGRR